MPEPTDTAAWPDVSAAKIAGLIFLSLVQFRLFIALHGWNMFDISEAAREVLIGTPQHLAFQSRVLGPSTVQAVAWLTGFTYQTGHTVVLLLLTIAANLLAFGLVRSLTGSADLAFRYTVFYLAAATTLLSGEWVFVWDFIGMPVFLLFAYGVIRRKSLAYFLAVFAVGILNRESVLVIPLWLAVDAFADENGRLGLRLRNVTRLVTGVVLLMAGFAYTLAVRHWLFVRSSLAEPEGNALPYIGNQWNIVESVHMAALALLDPGYDLVIVVHLAWLLLAAFLIRHWHRLAAYRSACVIVILMCLAVPTFGFFDEIRQYLYLLPFVLMFDLVVRGRFVPARS